MWTREAVDAGIENLVIYLVKCDNKPMFYMPMPKEGFLVRVPALDRTEEEADGTEKQIPYVSRGGSVELCSYDWGANPKGYCAVAEGTVAEC